MIMVRRTGLIGLSVSLVILLLSAAAAVFFGKRISNPLIKAVDMVRQIRMGDYSGRLQVRSGDEIQQLAEAMNDFSNDLESAIKDINKVMGGYTQFPHHPLLNGLHNELIELSEFVYQDPAFSQLKEVVRGKPHPTISMLCIVWQTIEHECLMAGWRALDRDPRIAWIFDGMLVPKELYDENTIDRLDEATKSVVPGIQWSRKEWI